VDEPYDPTEPAPDPTFSRLTLERIEAEIAGVARAIEALDAGTYGTCEQCGAAIDADRLRDDPLLVRCEAHPLRPELFTVDA
jgi:RNA polymerase-binding transcription factor DksA